VEILQPGVGPIRAATYLPADPAQLFWGRLPCETDAAVLTVESGTEVTIDTISHEGVLDDQGSDPVAFFARHGVRREAVLDDAVELVATRERDADDGPHVITGPIHVAGARAGDVLAVDIIELLPRVPYGVISNRHGRGALPGEYPRGDSNVSIFAAARDGEGWIPRRTGATADVHFPLSPFLGTMGVAVPGAERPHSVPPGHHGGNIDIKLLVAGATLYLPVLVDGVGFFVGDPHFAQGDGEVALTAMEASLRATVRLRRVGPDSSLARIVHDHGPLVQTPEWIVPTGMHPDLAEANRRAVRAAIALLVETQGMDEEHAYAYLSAATDFDISQVVDRVTGVHARIRKADFE